VSLPEDSSQWPTDPFELLGVTYDSTQKDAKRAYMKLIKLYKPEFAPTEFQIIREAYEFVVRQLEAQAFYAEEDKLEVRSEGPENKEKESESAWSPLDLAANSEIEDSPNEVTQLWQTACDGDLKSAYDGLRTLVESTEPPRGDCCLRLYWLLKTTPELDSQRDAIDWLTLGACRDEHSAALLELYRREIDRNNFEVVSDRFVQLMNRTRVQIEQGAAPNELMELLAWRWDKAMRMDRANMLLEDFRWVERLLEYDHQASLSQLCMLALDHLAWLSDETILRGVRELEACLENIPHCIGTEMLDYELDRNDLLQEVAEEWREGAEPFRRLAPWLGSLPPHSWVRSPLDLREELLPILKEIGKDPSEALHRFDHLTQLYPALVNQIGSLFESYRNYFRDYHDEERAGPEVDAEIQQFLWSHARGEYFGDFRSAFLKFCCEYAIEPLMVCHLPTVVHEYPGLVELVQQDVNLDYMYQAYRAFWG